MIKYTALLSLLTTVHSEPLVHEFTKTEQFLTVLSSLKEAALISVHFFKAIFSFIHRLVLCPVSWAFQLIWSLIRRPLSFIVYAHGALYPILLFCLVAACCGLFIGGCAGFASEAFSSVVIEASWANKKEVQKSDPAFHNKRLSSPVLIRRIKLSSMENKKDLL